MVNTHDEEGPVARRRTIGGTCLALLAGLIGAVALAPGASGTGVAARAEGPVTVSIEGPRYRRGLHIPVAWSASDAEPGVTSYNVDYRGIPWDSPSAQSTSWKAGTTDTSATLTAEPGTNYCFYAVVDGSRGGPSERGGTQVSKAVGPVCAVTPVDDREAVRHGFVTRSGQGWFRGTWARATRAGSTLTWRHGRAAYISLLLASGPHDGKVRVTFGQRPPVVVDLHSRTERLLRVKTIASYGRLYSGALKVTVLSHGKPVRIDGAYFARDADDEYP